MRRFERSRWRSGSPGRGRCGSGARVRGLPHRPPRRRRRAPDPKLPLVLGHQIVGVVATRRARASTRFELGDRVGVPWLGWTCGACPYCLGGRENLCDDARFTGYTDRRRLRRGGGRRRALLLPDPRGVPRPAGGAAPVRRADRLPRAEARRRRASGSGSTGSARPRTSLPRSRAAQGRRVFAFTRAGDASSAGVRARAGGRVGRAARDERPPEPLDAAIIFAPAGELVPAALRAVAAGRQRRVRRDPHERHPRRSRMSCSGRSGGPLGGQPHARRRREFLALAPRGAGADAGARLPARGGRTRRSRGCARARSAARSRSRSRVEQ